MEKVVLAFLFSSLYITSMIKKVWDYIRENNMINSQDKVLVGVSGGADSICLLFVLSRLRSDFSFELAVLHVNHMLRGSEAEEDEQFVRQMCAAWGIPEYAVEAHDVARYAREQGLSTEEAGRSLRYHLFEKYRIKWGCNKVAVAHHKDDSTETILLNLFRGSGLKGLAGIEPVRGNIIRPLLCVERRQIEEFLAENEITYRTDSTNLTENYTRNRIRNHILPYIEKEINAQASEHILQAGSSIREAEQYLEAEAEKIYQKYAVKAEKMVILNLECKKNVPEFMAGLVFRMCIRQVSDSLKDITRRNIESIHQLCAGNTGKTIDLPYEIIVEKSYEDLIFRKREKKESKEDGEWEIHPPCDIELGTKGMRVRCTLKKNEKTKLIPQKPYTKWFDYDKMKFMLQIRHRKTGDYLTVYSSGRTQKLKDYFINEKIKREERDQVWLVADGKEIVWVIGYRMNEAYKVTEQTKNILEIMVYGGKNERKN